MCADQEVVRQLYRSDPEREWLRLERHRTEFAVTLRAFEAYMPPAPARVLDCGGGPGRYAITLAQQGYEVTLFDLSPELLNWAREQSAELGVTLSGFEQGTATDLSRFPDASFDVVLLMGPLYHLLDEAERCRALAEAYRVLRPGGVVFVAFITRYAAHRYAAAHIPMDPLSAEQREAYRSTWETGILHPPSEGLPGFFAYMAHPTEVKPLCRGAGFEVLSVLGVEGLVSMLETEVNALEGDAWDFWVDLNYQVASDPSVHGVVEHLLAVCRKPKWCSVLQYLVPRLNEAGIVYKVVGGTSLALRGFDVPVHDIDLEMSFEDVYRFQDLFSEFAVEPVAWRETESVRSHFGRFDFEGVLVEVMAGLQRRCGSRWLPSFFETEAWVEWEGLAVRVLCLEEEVLAYIRRGKLSRAALCLPACNSRRLLTLMQKAGLEKRLIGV